MAPWGALALLLALLWAGGAPFELGEALRGLRGDNARLEGTLRNLSRALGQLRARLRDPPDLSWSSPEPPPPPPAPPACGLGPVSGGAPPHLPAAPPGFLGVSLLLLLLGGGGVLRGAAPPQLLP